MSEGPEGFTSHPAKLDKLAMASAQIPSRSSQRPGIASPRLNYERQALRKPIPSPLQVTQISTPTQETFAARDTPRQRDPSQTVTDRDLSTTEGSNSSFRMRDHSRRNGRSQDEGYEQADAAEATENSLSTTPRGLALRMVRNTSPSISGSDSVAGASSHPPSEASLPETKQDPNHDEAQNLPRTSSIDSTISTASSATTHSHASSRDSLAVSDAEVVNGVRKAGSPEAFIRQLLREKKQASAQNAKLWKLFDGQRKLIFGLKADLEQTTLDKERFKRLLRERGPQHRSTREIHTETPRGPSPAPDASPVPSQDEFPIQSHGILELNSSQEQDSVDTTSFDKLSDPSDSSSGSFNASPTIDSPNMSPTSPDPETAEDTRRNTVVHAPSKRAVRSESQTQGPSLTEEHHSPRTPKTPDFDNVSSRAGFTARRSTTTPRRKCSIQNPGTPNDDPTSPSPNARKAPPAPLNLRRNLQPSGQPAASSPNDDSDSEYEENEGADASEAFDRGRKKTREEDDRERETVLQREPRSGSQPKKEESGKTGSKHLNDEPAEARPDVPNQHKSPAIRAFAPIESSLSQSGHLTAPASLMGILSSPRSDGGRIVERVISPPALSPGLPVSPRPVDRPTNSPYPRQPRDGYLPSAPLPSAPLPSISTQLSPRAPQARIQLASSAPSSAGLITSPVRARLESERSVASSALKFTVPPRSPISQPFGVQTTGGVHARPEIPSTSRFAGIYQGLVSDHFPDFLLPPNALPSIQINVASSRLRPSRHSSLMSKGLEDDLVFTLGISARSDGRQLWRVEKSIMSLPQLDHQLRYLMTVNTKLPDRSLFAGHSPAKIDARRLALEAYFESVLDTQMSEKAAFALCHYLSTHALPAEDHVDPGPASTSEVQNQQKRGSDGRTMKEGFLTKRGKNFGGWKARFFVLDEPILRYYESPGGALLGTIKLTDAQIGRQSAPQSSHSPSRGGEDSENQFRHAFLILEPKKNHLNSVIRHVLCAENDAERDEWVAALLQYIGLQTKDDKLGQTLSRTESRTSKASSTAQGETRDGLQGLCYTDMAPSQTPRLVPITRQAQTPSPPVYSGTPNSIQASPVQSVKIISGPSNGTIIQDAGAWGNRALDAKAVDSPKVHEKEQKKRSFWGFGFSQTTEATSTHSSDSNTTSARPTNVRPVFGAPLAEAVEYCMAPGSSVCLPAVMYRCLEYLESQGAQNEEGIFRLSGSNVTIKQLRERFNTDGDLDFLASDNYYDVHAVASLLKLYLRELPASVLTWELHEDFMRVLDIEDRSQKISAYNVLVHRLPLPNWTLVRALSAFLIGIVNNCHINKMNIRNVCIVFSPTLNIPAPIFSAFLTDFDAIFEAEPEQSAPAIIEVSAPTPRRQTFPEIQPPPANQHENSSPGWGGLGVNYEEVLQYSQNINETGNVDVQHSPGTPTTSRRRHTEAAALGPSITMAGPEYGAVRQRPTPPMGLSVASHDVKARRRESVMLLPGMRKASMPLLPGGADTLKEHQSHEYGFEVNEF